jgi:hypothetical protein
VTSARLRELVPEVMLHESRLFLRLALPAGSPACPFAGFTFLTASPPHSNDRLWCRTITPAFHRLRLQRPRLRSRLTLGRLTLPRNPQAFGVNGSHIDDATHSGILSSLRSTCPCGQASLPRERSPTMISLKERSSTASVRCLSLATLSAPGHSTSELLRTLSMMAASKPTSWLSLRPDYL